MAQYFAGWRLAIRVCAVSASPQIRPPAKCLLQPPQAAVHYYRIDSVLLQLALLICRRDESQSTTLTVALPNILSLAYQRSSSSTRLPKLLILAVGEHALQEAQLGEISLLVVVPVIVRRDHIFIAAVAKAKTISNRHGNITDV